LHDFSPYSLVASDSAQILKSYFSYILKIKIESNDNQIINFLATIFDLKPIFSNVSISTPSFLWFPFALNIFYHPFTFSLCVPLKYKWVTDRQQIATRLLLIGELNLFLFKVTIEM
jgi:hypothetical protein